MTRTIDNTQDVLDSREVIERIEELEGMDERDAEEAEELRVLKALEEEAAGSPDWRYGETLVRDSYFVEYAQELADDCGMLDKGDRWPYTCIDWEHAAKELQYDYSAVDFGGVTYWIRS